MPRAKQASKRKRAVQAAVPALGAAGLTFSLAGSASAAMVPPTDGQLTGQVAPGQAVILGEEEISDVTLATFHVFDKENLGVQGEVQLTRCRCGGCGCRGCRGCGGCRGCRCGCGGCGVGWYGGGCCLSWGACRLC